MLPNQNLSKADAKWLLNDFQPIINKGMVKGKNISMYTKALNLMRGTNLTNPGCSCEYGSRGNIAESVFNQYKSEIEKVANAV
jgi:hypothetical protein